MGRLLPPSLLCILSNGPPYRCTPHACGGISWRPLLDSEVTRKTPPHPHSTCSPHPLSPTPCLAAIGTTRRRGNYQQERPDMSKDKKTLWGNVSYIKVDLDVAFTEVLFCFLFCFVSHSDLVVLDPNFITLVLGRTLTDSYHFKQPFIVTASTVHFLFFFNISHFLAEISSRKHQNFYNEDKIKISHIRFLL